MAENQKGSGKIWAIVFFLFFAEFLYIVFSKPADKPSPIKIEGTIQNLINDLYTPIDFSTPKKVLTYLVDANDQSGDIKDMGKENTILLTLPKSSNPNVIKGIQEPFKINEVRFFATSGKKAQDMPPGDDDIKAIVDKSEINSNDFFSVENISENNDHIEILIRLNFKKTGYYKFDFLLNINRLTIHNNLVSIGNIKIDLNTTKENIDKSEIQKKWNNLSGSLYFCVVDATKPQDNAKKIPITIDRVQ
jgi:hypothetical protein